MGRSKWKGPYINLKVFTQFKAADKKSSTVTISRDSFIIPAFLGYKFKVYNGNSFSEIAVNREMISHKFGEFYSTRKLFVFKKKKKKKR